MKGWLMAPQVGLAKLLPLPSKDCTDSAAAVNMVDTRVEMEEAILNMGQPEELSPPKAEKAQQLLHRRSRANSWGQSLSMAVAREVC